MEGLTLSEMAEILRVPQRTVERRVQRAGIKALTKEALYPPDTLDKIREAPRGRPKKAKEPEPSR
jgi:hypothetical protein